MTPEAGPTPSAHEVRFTIDYGVPAALGGGPNPDFAGSGTLTVNTAVSRFRFTGHPQRWLAFRSKLLSFEACEIWDVTVADRVVSFATGKGECGQQGALFVFRAQDAAQAAAIVSLLPKHTAADFAETRDFAAKLHRLPSATSWWGSVTNVLVALNVAVFLAMAMFCDAGWFGATNLLPYIRYGANNAAATTDGEWWRLLTSLFMHYGAVHLLLNTWALLQVGHTVEKLLGRGLYALCYFGSGIAGGLASLWWHGDAIWSAGASGAVFGVYGTLLGYMLREKLALPRRVYQPLMNSTLVFVAYNLLNGLTNPRIDNAAHIGGCLGGIALGWLVALPLDLAARTRHAGRRLRLGFAACMAIVAAGIAVAPRFDYHVGEELAWHDLAEEFRPAERTLLRREQTLRAQCRARPDNSAEFAAFITDELRPFYAHWEDKLAALAVSPGTRTERRAQALRAILHKRVSGCQSLLDGLGLTPADALRAYERLNRELALEQLKLAAP